MGLFNELFGWIGRIHYKNKFESHFKSFENFVKFIEYEEKAKQGIQFLNYVNRDELEKIYNSIKHTIKFKDNKRIGTRHLTGYVSLSHYRPREYYDQNIVYFYKHFNNYVKQIALPKIEKENAKQKVKKQEEKEELRQKQQNAEKTKVKITQVFKSKNQFQNNAESIGIKYLILNTGQEFVDFITNPNSLELSNNNPRSIALFEYKLSRFLLATDTSDISDIFKTNFENLKSKLIGKEIIIDTVIENGKRKIDLFIGSIFYHKK